MKLYNPGTLLTPKDWVYFRGVGRKNKGEIFMIISYGAYIFRPLESTCYIEPIIKFLYKNKVLEHKIRFSVIEREPGFQKNNKLLNKFYPVEKFDADTRLLLKKSLGKLLLGFRTINETQF